MMTNVLRQFELISRFMLLIVLVHTNPAKASDDDLDLLLAEEATISGSQQESEISDNGFSSNADSQSPSKVIEGESEKSLEKPQSTESRIIDEIIVTATKRDESVRDLPISIDAFSADDLAERGALGLEEILKYSPGVTFKKGGHADSSSVTIRGIGGTSKYFNRTFGIFYRDVPLVNPSLVGPQPDVDPYDLHSVEVLKGPQGHLFGGSALAGAVRYVPREPEVDEAYGQLVYTYSSLEESEKTGKSIGLMFNQPLSETVALRATGSKREFPGYVDSLYRNMPDTNDAESWQGQMQLRWLPNDSWDIKAYRLSRKAGNDDSTSVDHFDNPDNQYFNSVNRVAEDGEAKLSVTGIELNWDGLPGLGVVLTSNQVDKSGFLHLDITRALGANVVEQARSRQEHIYGTDQISHGLRLVSDGISEHDWWLLDNWKFVFGVFYLKADQFVALDVPIPIVDIYRDINNLDMELGLGLGSLLTSLPSEESVIVKLDLYGLALTTEKALYFDATKYLADGLFELNIGGRFYRQKSVGGIPTYATLAVQGQDEVSTLVDEAWATLSDSGFNPKLALTWRPSDELSLFASAIRGFRYGGFNADPYQSQEPPPTYDSDELWSYEIGVRSDWLDGALQLDFTTFYLKWKDMQLEEWTSRGAGSYIVNIGGSDNLGAELGLKWLMPWDVLLVSNLAYSDARYSESFTTPSGNEGKEGTKLPNSPNWTGSLILSKESEWRGINLGGNLSYSYQGDSKNDINNSIPLEAFNTWGASIYADFNHWPMKPRLQLTGTNLTGERASLYGVYEVISGVAEYATRELLKPREITLSVSLHY